MNLEKMKKELIIAKLNELPTLPVIYQKLVDTMANRHSTTNDIAKIISTDQVSASKVLRIANSPIFRINWKNY
jgi:HD-like signal output (HDOD) protein